MASSHLSLRRLFNRYNKLYFNSELPQDTKLIWSPLTDAHGHQILHEIHMDPALALYPKFLRIILLHEMVHLHQPRATHGKVFRREIDRLYQAGAFDGLL